MKRTASICFLVLCVIMRLLCKKVFQIVKVVGAALGVASLIVIPTGTYSGLPANAALTDSILVNTLLDVADPPFASGSGTVADLPGNDGYVSLREALIAANNTGGPQTIRFADTLKGSDIAIKTPLPAITGDGTTVEGDVDNDKIPDISLTGNNSFPGITVYASNVNISTLGINSFNVGVEIGVASRNEITDVTVQYTTFNDCDFEAININHNNTKNRVIRGIAIIHNTITQSVLTQSGLMGISISAGSGANASGNQILDVTINENKFSGGNIAIYTNGAILGGTNNLLANVNISANSINNLGNSAIIIAAGGGGVGTQNNTTRNVVIEGNTVTETECAVEMLAAGGPPPPPWEIPLDRGLEQSGNTLTDVTVARNIIRNNTAGVWVVGAYGDSNSPEVAVRRNTVSAVTIINNTISDQKGGGIFVNTSAFLASENSILNTTIENNIIARNTSGITLWPSFSMVNPIPPMDSNLIADTTIGGNLFLENELDGLTLNSFSNDLIKNTYIVNNVFIRNTKDGFSLNTRSSPNMNTNIEMAKTMNNTLVRNRLGGVGVTGDGVVTGLSVVNTIFWENGQGDQAKTIDAPPSSSFLVAHSNIIDKDPLFVDPSKDDYHLRAASPAIDKGSKTIQGIPPIDFDGKARIVDGDNDGSANVDIGAFEFIPAPTATPSPAPTSTSSPAPTVPSSAAPTATPSPAPTATPFGIGWWVWFIAGLLIIVAVAIIIWRLRHRRI